MTIGQFTDFLTKNVVTITGTLSAFTNNDGGTLNNENLGAQTAASAMALAAGTTGNFWAAADSVVAGGVAFVTGTQVLLNDVNTSKGGPQIVSDFLTVMGDSAIIAGGILQLIPTPQSQLFGRVLDFAGDAATMGTMGFDNYSSYVRSVSPGLSALISSISPESQSVDSSASSVLTGTGSSSAWNAVQSGISTAYAGLATVISDEGTGSFNSAVSAEQSDISALQTSLSTLYGTLGVSLTDDPLSLSGNTVTVTGGPTGSPSSTVSLTESSDGTQATLGTLSSDGSVNTTQVDTWNSAGSITDNFQSTATGNQFTDNTTSTSSGSQTTSITGQGDISALTNDTVSLGANSKATVTGLSDTITFGSASTLSLLAPTTFTGTVSNFVGGDTIDLSGVTGETGLDLTGPNYLELNGSVSDEINLSPTQNFAGDQFYFGSDGNGGTDITESSAAIAPIQVSGYTLVDATGINDAGAIVGWYGNGGTGFLDTNGTITPIYDNVSPGDQVPTKLVGVNNAGQLLGSFSFNSSFIDTNGVFTAIYNPAYYITQATAINDSGKVVGYYQTSAGSDHLGFLYNNGAFTSVAVSGALDTTPTGINDAGVIVGYYYDNVGLGQHCFIDNAGVITTFDAPFGDTPDSLSINNNGEILINGYYNSYLYNNGVITQLSFGTSSGTNATFQGLGINDSGEVVGSESQSRGTEIGFSYLNDVTASNTDLSDTNFSGASDLTISQGWTKLTAAQFSAVGALSVTTGTGTVYAASAGTYDLTTKTITGTLALSAAQTSANVSLVGSAAGQTLTGGVGNDNLTVTNGAETLTGGSGTTNFYVLWEPNSIAGTVLNAGTGTNTLNTWSADLSVLTINGSIPTLNANQTWVKMTAAQFAGFTTLNNQNTGGTHVLIEAGSDGTYDLTTKTTSGIFDVTLAGTSGVDSVTGNAAGETLTGGWGWDTFGSTTINETLDGGTGTNNFNVAWQAASIAGTVINGVTGAVANIVHTWDADLSVITINNCPTLDSYQSWVEMTNAEFTAFTTFTAETTGIDLIAANAGTYNLSTKTVNGSGTFNMDASSTSANVTLIGNGTAAQTLLGGSGTDVLTSGNGAGDIMTAGTGATTMNAGTGNDIFNAGASGNDTLNGGQGTETYKFGSTFGQDIINNIASGNRTTVAGAVDFGSGVTDEKLWFKQSGNNLLIELIGTTDTLTIDNWYGSNAGAQVASLVDTTDSLSLTTAAQVASLVSAMAAYQGTHSSFNAQASGTTMPGDTTLQNAITAAWHH